MTSWGSLEESIARHNPERPFRLAMRSAPQVGIGSFIPLEGQAPDGVDTQPLPSTPGGSKNR